MFLKFEIPMRSNQLIINAAKLLYLKHSGQNHRLIEREMHALGCRRFTRRSLYNQKTKTGYRLGWIEKFGWKRDLAENNHLPDRDAVRFTDSSPSSHQSPAISSLPLCVSAVRSSSPTAHSQPPTFQDWLKLISPNLHWDWPYQKLIYEQLERVTRGECKRLMIFLPPRHGKSELVTNRYAAWRLRHDPTINIILGSYNQRLANRFSRKVRITWEDSQLLDAEINTRGEAQVRCNPQVDAVTSPNDRTEEVPVPSPIPHQSFSPPSNRIRQRLNTVAEWETGAGGGVRAVGVGGGITGFGADLVIIDDPIKSRAEAESKTYRERVWDWFNDDLYTRLEPNAAIILIQTRWHEDDLAGRLLKDSADGGEHWDVISLPALAESEPPSARNADALVRMSAKHEPASDTIPESLSPMGNNKAHCEAAGRNPGYPQANYNPLPEREQQATTDPLGRRPGEPLCPDRFPKEDLERIKRRLGSYSFSALYQQRPTPPEGGLFKRSWFSQIVDKPPEHLRWCRGYDLAISTKDSADYTASVRCALDKTTGELYIADGFRKRMEFPEQKRFIVDRIRNEKNTEHGIEQALHGMAFIQELRREERLFGRAFRGIKVKGDKFTRALSWANLAEEGKVILVRGAWIDEFLEEICTFPNSRHDDQLDAVSIAVEMIERRKHVAFGF
jgi:predicted phage terminase large subunit-like protein